MSLFINNWKIYLFKVLTIYDKKTLSKLNFSILLFLFFTLINLFCYWLAMITAFPDLVFGPSFNFYFKVQFPVGILGSMFDTMSFFITLKIIRNALRSKKLITFLSHLSIDIIIAALATMWVLFVFSFSGWLISLTETQVEVLSSRNELYKERVINALEKPNDNLRNIYFGVIMGISAMIPTIFHLFSGLRAFIKGLKKYKQI